MNEQLSMLPQIMDGEDYEDLQRQIENAEKYLKQRRKWERAYQKWSNKNALDEATPLGKCGYGSACDWCTDPSTGNPCVRAFNAMRRDRKLEIDYRILEFERIWNI